MKSFDEIFQNRFSSAANETFYCSGPTSYYKNEKCHCAVNRGIVLVNQTSCECSLEDNFFWNETSGECQCLESFKLTLNGKCSPESTSMFWDSHWTGCHSDQGQIFLFPKFHLKSANFFFNSGFKHSHFYQTFYIHILFRGRGFLELNEKIFPKYHFLNQLSHEERERRLKKATCSTLSGPTRAPWFQCKFNSDKIIEPCEQATGNLFFEKYKSRSH